MKTNQKFSGYYEECEFNLPTGQTNIPLSYIMNVANGYTFTGAFLSKFGGPGDKTGETFPTRLVIRTNQTITVSTDTEHADRESGHDGE